MGEIVLFEVGDTGLASRDCSLRREAQSEGKDSDPAASVPPPALGHADDLQVSEAASAQSPQHATGDTKRAGPGQEVVLRTLPRAWLRLCAALCPEPVRPLPGLTTLSLQCLAQTAGGARIRSSHHLPLSKAWVQVPLA